MNYQKKWFLEEQVVCEIAYNRGHNFKIGCEDKVTMPGNYWKKKEQKDTVSKVMADFTPHWEMRHQATPTLLLPSSAFPYNVAGIRQRNL